MIFDRMNRTVRIEGITVSIPFILSHVFRLPP